MLNILFEYNDKTKIKMKILIKITGAIVCLIYNINLLISLQSKAIALKYIKHASTLASRIIFEGRIISNFKIIVITYIKASYI